MELNLKWTHDDISLRLDHVKIKKYIYIVFSHKLWCMLLGTGLVFLSRIC